MHRFFVEQNLDIGGATVKSPELAHQLHTVLKVKSGEEVALFCAEPHQGAGWDFVFRISKIGKGSVEGAIIEKIKNDREPKFLLTLYQSILKKDNFEWILQKGAEIGVAEFVPVVSARSVKTRLNHMRARKILKEAAEQSGRAILPALTREMDFYAALQEAKAAGGLLVFAHEKEMAQKIDSLPLSGQMLHLFIGPEGGFSEEEAAKARATGCFAVSLSRRTLRAETAAIAASYFLLHRFGY